MKQKGGNYKNGRVVELVKNTMLEKKFENLAYLVFD